MVKLMYKRAKKTKPNERLRRRNISDTQKADVVAKGANNKSIDKVQLFNLFCTSDGEPRYLIKQIQQIVRPKGKYCDTPNKKKKNQLLKKAKYESKRKVRRQSKRELKDANAIDTTATTPKDNIQSDIKDESTNKTKNQEQEIVAKDIDINSDDSNTKSKVKLRLPIGKRIVIEVLSTVCIGLLVFVFAVAYATDDVEVMLGEAPEADLFIQTIPVPTEPPLYEVARSIEVFREDEASVVELGAINTINEQVLVVGSITTKDIVLDVGDNCKEVLYVQEELIELGYLIGNKASQDYDESTAFAITLFQRQHSMSMDGVADRDVLEKLYSNDAKGYLVKRGAKGEDIRLLQERLIKLRYLASSFKSTGVFGSKTETAVKDFQKRNKLSADGVVGGYTHIKIYSSSARRASSGSATGAGIPKSPYANGTGSGIVNAAKSLMGQGTPYVYGGKTPVGFDCSGFVFYALNYGGVATNYRTSTAWASANYTTITEWRDLKPGDVCVYPGHCGIYIGNNQMIHCTSWSGGSGIIISSISSSYRTSNFICGKRLVK